MTLHLNEASGYYPLLGHNLLMAINSVFLLADPSTSLLTLILATRLFNNLMVNDYLLTIQIAR